MSNQHQLITTPSLYTTTVSSSVNTSSSNQRNKYIYRSLSFDKDAKDATDSKDFVSCSSHANASIRNRFKLSYLTSLKANGNIRHQSSLTIPINGNDNNSVNSQETERNPSKSNNLVYSRQSLSTSSVSSSPSSSTSSSSCSSGNRSHLANIHVNNVNNSNETINHLNRTKNMSIDCESAIKHW
jgi:hypothetical protein